MKIIAKKQPNSIACGPTSIFMVTRFFGDSITFKHIEQLSEYKKHDGMTDKQICALFNRIGYIAEHTVNTKWQDIKQFLDSGFAIIVSWMKDGYKGHVSVVQKISDTHIYLADPDVGKIIKIEKIKFMRLWMEYDDLWWPEKVSDINLRSIIKIRKK